MAEEDISENIFLWNLGNLLLTYSYDTFWRWCSFGEAMNVANSDESDDI